jgi:hypothetical protein
VNNDKSLTIYCREDLTGVNIKNAEYHKYKSLSHVLDERKRNMKFKEKETQPHIV